MNPYVVVLVNRLAELAEEREAIEATLSARAGEWYRQHSGRTHFHPLEFREMADGNLEFVTPIRDGEIEVIIPIDWFNSKNPVESMSLTELCSRWAPGSYDDDWTWEDEENFLWGKHYSQMLDLVHDIKQNGMNRPVLLGDDGRVWDGHHRVCIAMYLGLEHVPVRFSTTIEKDKVNG